MSNLEKIRKAEKVFVTNADTWTIETKDRSVLSIVRAFEGEKIVGLFNFSEYDKTLYIDGEDGEFTELISGTKKRLNEISLPAYGYYYLKKNE